MYFTYGLFTKNVKLRHLVNYRCHQSTLQVPELKKFPQFLKNAESKWRRKLEQRFERERFVSAKGEKEEDCPPRYILSMFPYPSGRLHLGHVRIYTSADILARQSRLLSKNENREFNFKHVINPMGFDSFGLPAENAARERGINPAIWTNSNIRAMKQQLDDLALQFDWREATSNPSFYKWTQQLFLKLMDAGLVYKSYAQVNWDPVDKTVLADEQVDEEGKSWRSGAIVEKRIFKQWFVKTNRFTNDIYEAEDVNSECWGDILSIQRNWIGKPNGWLFYLPIPVPNQEASEILPVFSKNPEFFLDTSAQLMIKRGHWLEQVFNISNTGSIKNPINSSQLPVVIVDDSPELPPSGYATLTVNLKHSDENQNSLLRQQVLVMSKLSKLDAFYTSESYRDWLVSRQRFWGTPIPVAHCSKCGYHGVEEASLPLKLPTVKEFQLSSHKGDHQDIVPPIKELAPPEWINITCKTCGGEAVRECETLDTLFDSSWYFLRYATSPSNEEPFDPKRVQQVYCYLGGKEHANMHLFYARFITHFLHHLGHLHFKEPFRELLVQGIVKSRTHKLNGKYLSDSEVASLEDTKGLLTEYEKMSKSKGNGVDPQQLLDEYGIDATRFCLMSYANPRSERLWRTSSEEFKDVLIYLRRLSLTVEEYMGIGNSLTTKTAEPQSRKLRELGTDELKLKKDELVKVKNETIIKATFYLQESRQFRQYISSLHTHLNNLRSNLNSTAVYTVEFANSLATLIVLLNPIAPHLSEELWTYFSKCVIKPLIQKLEGPFKMNMQASDQPWPTTDDDYPLKIKIRHRNCTNLTKELEISKDKLNSLSKIELASLVESYFSEKNDKCQVLEVQKYPDLMAVVIANIQSKKENLIKNRKKKKINNKNTPGD